MNQEFFSTKLQNDAGIKPFGDGLYLFHGINKSGSGAFADVARSAFFNSKRADQFFSRYHGCPSKSDELLKIISHAQSRARLLFIDHYLYGASPLRGVQAKYLTIFRHPLSRIVSTHSWLKRKHDMTSSTDPFPTLETAVKKSRGIAHSQISQIAIGFPDDRKDLLRKANAPQLFDTAVHNLERDFLWFGLAEYFEESIFLFANLFELPMVAPWKQDRRNPSRTNSFELPLATRRLIEKEYEYEFLFYEKLVKHFRSICERVEFGDGFRDYVNVCANQYKDRILDFRTT
jgi:hypothetical protein